MRRIHPAGLYEAICPLANSDGSSRYMLRVAEGRRKEDPDHARSLLLSRNC